AARAGVVAAAPAAAADRGYGRARCTRARLRPTVTAATAGRTVGERGYGSSPPVAPRPNGAVAEPCRDSTHRRRVRHRQWRPEPPPLGTRRDRATTAATVRRH